MPMPMHSATRMHTLLFFAALRILMQHHDKNVLLPIIVMIAASKTAKSRSADTCRQAQSLRLSASLQVSLPSFFSLRSALRLIGRHAVTRCLGVGSENTGIGVGLHSSTTPSLSTIPSMNNDCIIILIQAFHDFPADCNS